MPQSSKIFFITSLSAGLQLFEKIAFTFFKKVDYNINEKKLTSIIKK